jgi:hypothetical protein
MYNIQLRYKFRNNTNIFAASNTILQENTIHNIEII